MKRLYMKRNLAADKWSSVHQSQAISPREVQNKGHHSGRHSPSIVNVVN